MKILFVAFADSIHTARWIAQIVGCGWDIHLLPSEECDECHAELHGVTIHHAMYTRQADDRNSYEGVYIGWRALYRFLKSNRPAARVLRKLVEMVWKIPLKDGRTERLEKLISQLRPDIIHSLETQHAGYLVMEARKRLGRLHFPAWIHTNWGSDIYLFGRLPAHRPRIKELLSLCEYYACECNRDVVLAREYGFRGTVAIVAPDTGGFDFTRIRQMLPSCPKTSERRAIMLKGYQGWSGRALVGIRALARARDLLNGYHVYIHSSNHTEDIQIAAELLSQDAGIPVTILKKLPHQEILRLHGMARISIGLGISDGTPQSLLEAMIMGAFPIQSWTAAADEWIEHGKTGMLVPPEDPEEIEQALRVALTSDDLVDTARTINYETAEKRLDSTVIKSKVVEMYRVVYGGKKREAAHA